MKVVNNKEVYVQKKDIDFLFSLDVDIPSFLLLKLWKDGYVCASQEEKDEFIKFRGELLVNYFKNLDFIIDYNDVNGLSSNDLFLIIDNLSLKMIDSKDFDYQDLSDIDKKNKMLNYKIDSLKEIFKSKRANLEIDIPEEIISYNNKTGIKKLVKSILKK